VASTEKFARSNCLPNLQSLFFLLDSDVQCVPGQQAVGCEILDREIPQRLLPLNFEQRQPRPQEGYGWSDARVDLSAECPFATLEEWAPSRRMIG
jgi:hypothetical protein